MSDLKENLKTLRFKYNLSQEDVAEKINKTRATYSRYETGTLTPDIETLIQLADLYCVSLDYITGRVSSTEEWAKKYMLGFAAGQEMGNKILRKRISKKKKTTDNSEASTKK